MAAFAPTGRPALRIHRSRLLLLLGLLAFAGLLALALISSIAFGAADIAPAAVAGPVGFVGLLIPHAVRFLVGQDYRWVLPYAALVGASFLILADIAARLVLRPTELPLGVMTALIGGPFFIFLVRWRVSR